MVCCRCKEDKEKFSFHKNNNKVSGIQSICKECKKETDKIRYKTSDKKITNKLLKQKLIQFLNEYKQDLGCQYCGEDCPACLDFHHTDKKNKIANVSTLSSLRTIKLEIAKCIVACSNCHRKIHAGLL